MNGSRAQGQSDGVFLHLPGILPGTCRAWAGRVSVAMASTAAIEGASRSSHSGSSKGVVPPWCVLFAVELARYKIRSFESCRAGSDRNDRPALQREIRRHVRGAFPRTLGRRAISTESRLLASGATAYQRGRLRPSMRLYLVLVRLNLGEKRNDEEVRGLPGLA